jgi:hypothetical protein
MGHTWDLLPFYVVSGQLSRKKLWFMNQKVENTKDTEINKLL